MKLLRKGIPFALSMLAATAAQVAMATPVSPPTSGAYHDDKQNTWVQDRVGDRVSTVNMIMCIIGSMRGDAMVNQGPYVALIDEGKCQGRGDSSKSTSTSAGASNATNFMSAVVNATQQSLSDPLVIKAWLHEEEDDNGTPRKSTIYVYVEALEGKTDTLPNGRFKMYFCGEPDGMNGSCMFQGSLQSDAQGLSFYEAESGGGGGGGGGGGSTRLRMMNSQGDSGSGKIMGTESGSPYDYAFTYDGNHFMRKEGSNAAVCFDRREAHGETSTWRYGTYDSEGARLEIDDPGFAVKFVNGNDTYYGFWSFWGLWLPESAMSAIAQNQGTLTRHVGSADVQINPISKGGKLWKLARKTSSLGELKNVSMMYWSPNAIGTTDGTNPAPTNVNYEVQWDGEHALLNAVGYQQCDNNGCAPHPLHQPVALDAASLRASHVNALPIFFPSGGGNGSITVPASGAFQPDTVVSYRTRELVDPSESDMALNCVSQCPKTGTNLVDGGGHLASSPYKDNNSWGPSSVSYAYTFHAGMLDDGAANADASSADKSSLGNYQWGLNSGFMVTDADLDNIRCGSNGQPSPSGDHYCSGLVDQINTIYQWETGPNQWNHFFGATGVSISPPKDLSLNAVATFTNHVADAGNNIRGSSETQLSKFDGNKVQLQFSGFGELQGIPGGCVDPDTNLPVSCGQTSGGEKNRWVPAFDIKDGSTVGDGTHQYFVKFLERELRLSKVNCGAVSGALTQQLNGASSLNLPDATLVDINSKTRIGSEPTPGSTKPSVIDGIVQ